MKTCLIVDDEEQNRYLLDVLLRGHGYDTMTAANGAEALDKARRNPPDVAITDLLMPVMDGFALCKAWKTDERLRTVPLVVYTATYTDPRDEAFALNLGADRFLIKPMEAELFLKELTDVLGKAADGSLGSSAQAVGDEDFIHNHYKAIIRKLEDKMAEMHDLNARLTREIEEKEKAQAALEKEKRILVEAEGKLIKLNEELEQRVQLRTAQLELANREMEAFSYSVSHDLQAPLRSIGGFSQVLLEDYPDKPLDDTGRVYLEKIRKATHFMGQLIDDLLMLSRLIRAEFNDEPVDLSRMAKELTDTWRQENPGRNVVVAIEEGMVAHGDRRMLMIALTNLLGNALKFTGKEAQPRIEFGTVPKEDHAVYFVRDNGVGFDMTYAHKLFSPFQRLHATEEFPGTGIGLATVRRIIHRHSGRVWAEGAMDKGATFYFTLCEA